MAEDGKANREPVSFVGKLAITLCMMAGLGLTFRLVVGWWDEIPAPGDESFWESAIVAGSGICVFGGAGVLATILLVTVAYWKFR